jgi:transcriptional regulator with XRE-family HTH domain
LSNPLQETARMPPASPRPLLCAVLFILRELRGWTAEKLAEKAGVTTKTIWSWENKKPPARAKLEAVVALMGYGPETIDSLFLGLRLAMERPEEPLSPVDPSAALLQRPDGLPGAGARVPGAPRLETVES